MDTKIHEICRVVSVSQDLLQIEVLDAAAFKTYCGQHLTVGSYVKVSDDDGHAVIAIVGSYRIKDPTGIDPLSPVTASRFTLDAQPVGFLDPDGMFRRGGQQIAIPPTRVAIATESDLRAIYVSQSSTKLILGTLAREDRIPVPLDGDRFFAKHIAVVGSTGSGKSCTVAKILQEGIQPSDDQRQAGILNNSHIVIFDIHGEYGSAFPSSHKLTVDNLNLPYWLLNAEELEEIFIMSDEQNSHNQVTQFRHAVLQNKKRHNPDLTRVSYDSPVFFRLEEVFNFIANMNAEMIGKEAGQGCPILQDTTLVRKREEHYFDAILEFAEPSTSKGSKTSSGPFKGDFDRFVLRLRTILDDERMAFLLKPLAASGDEFKTADLEKLIADIIGYTNEKRSNMTIVDLSGIPFEVLSLVVSLIGRIIFDVGFYLKKGELQPARPSAQIPILAVYEEAHIYAPNSTLSKYRSVTKSIERIAKEGRKYGISLMIVSQRPSEISETIFSQCNNFVAMRLTNPADQNYVKRLLPDSVAGLIESLPVLEQREALVIGDAISLPTIVKIGVIKDLPDSHDVKVLTEWRENWRALPFIDVLNGMKRR
jgi:uncharacterized protein